MTKKVILTFPVDATDRPLTYDLIRIYDVKVNILKAEIQPGKTGSLLIEMEADPLRIEQAIAFLNDNGVTVRYPAKYLTMNPDVLIAGTALRLVSPTP